MGFHSRTQNLLQNISDTCRQVGRDPTTVTVIAVSKTFPSETINRYLNEVQDIFPRPTLPILGENKVQEVIHKKSKLQPHHLHFIGHLQTNKVKLVLPHIDFLHSLDSIKLADSLERELARQNRHLPVLIQANNTGEASKFGGGWEETRDLLHHVLTLPHLEVKGLMTIAPLTNEESIIRKCFRNLRIWQERLKEEIPPPSLSPPRSPQLSQLSMGMSHDYRIALEEGATMIRVGSILFGQRSYT